MAGDSNSLNKYNLGFDQDEYDALGDFEQQLAVRDYGRKAGQGIVSGYGDITRAAEQRVQGLGRTADLGRGLVTRGAGESWRQGIGSAGAGPVGGGSIAAMAGIGAAGGAQRAAFEAAMGDRMAEANMAAADARAQEAGAHANYAMMLSQMGTELDFINSQWAATADMRNTMMANLGGDGKQIAVAFVSEAMNYPEGHPMRKRWIQEAYDQGHDPMVTAELERLGVPVPENAPGISAADMADRERRLEEAQERGRNAFSYSD